ncbi:IS3 family transposase [Geochorda subterranea]|uniref:IS3 family transposase n=1 Tax=Geochorda subterranea TaxID=3109564 RepID=A0ABZ1BUE0_9FIRM|nr:IS3 family transposase [Limnochorda sp. LNt]WRP15778.1 IS3 family transposase [Limnochorda sp. LNt]
MDSVGDALDHAVAEILFVTLRTQLLNREPWPTRQALKTAIFEYIEAPYNRRRDSALGYLSSEEFARRWRLAATATSRRLFTESEQDHYTLKSAVRADDQEPERYSNHQGWGCTDG